MCNIGLIDFMQNFSVYASKSRSHKVFMLQKTALTLNRNVNTRTTQPMGFIRVELIKINRSSPSIITRKLRVWTGEK